MIPLAVPNLTGREREYLNRCIDTTFVSSVGEFVIRMEEMTAEICGTKYAVATSSGTTGLHLALMGVGVHKDDLVIAPSFTFIATANAISHCGALPWLMDMDEQTWTLDWRKLEEQLSEYTEYVDGKLIHKASGRRVAAVMPVYTLGNVAEMQQIKRTAEQYQLPVVADAACAIGAQYKGEKIGKWADLSVISFNGNKTVTAGGGGMVVGNNKELLDKIRHISTTARVNAEYDFDMVGYNYRMTNLQAAVGCAQLERVEEFVERKREIRQYYRTHLGDLAGIKFFPDVEDQYNTCWFSGIVLEEGGLNRVRELCQKLKGMGIEGRSFWKPVHLQKPYKDAVKSTSMEVTDKIWDHILTLPCSTGISDGQLAEVVGAVRQIIV